MYRGARWPRPHLLAPATATRDGRPPASAKSVLAFRSWLGSPAVRTIGSHHLELSIRTEWVYFIWAGAATVRKVLVRLLNDDCGTPSSPAVRLRFNSNVVKKSLLGN